MSAPSATGASAAGAGAGSDEAFMRAAVELAEKGRWTCHPNPAVGAVVVRDDAIVGKGYHARAGAPHAEALAIEEAGDLARGGDLYVTLEPCVHHGRTPPCVEAIAGSGIRRVVVAAVDPDEKVSGRGVEFLRNRGIDVVVGVLENEAVALDPAYFHHRLTGRPFIRYKFAATLDGFVAAADKSSKWITSEEARRDVQILRAESDAVGVGLGTVLADDPALTCRLEEYDGRQPLRIVFDSRGRITGSERIFSQPGSAMVITTAVGARRLADTARQAEFEHETASATEEPPWEIDAMPGFCIVDTGSGERVDVASAVGFLGALEILELLLEGGPTIAGSFFEKGLMDEIVAYTGARVLGGGGVPILAGKAAGSIEEAHRWTIERVTTIGDDLKIVARPVVREAGTRP